MEKKYQEILRFLSVGELPSTYNKGEKCTLKRFCVKFTLKDGEIFFGERQLVKSKEEAWTHFRDAHESPKGGHAGINKTCSTLSRRWYWNGMNIDVRKWIQQCEECQKAARTARKPLQCIKQEKCIKRRVTPKDPDGKPTKSCGRKQQRARKNAQSATSDTSLPPSPMDQEMDQTSEETVVSAVWELVGIDLVGPYPTTKDGYQYIFTATDYFSKWVEAFPLKSKSAVEVSEQICNLIYQYGFPRRILSDQGREFVNQLNEHICNLLGIDISLPVAAYQPQTNDLDEETNHNIKRALTELVNDQQNNWDVYLKPTLFSLRSKIQGTTNFSPFLLMYGREAVFPSEVSVELPFPIVLPGKETYKSFVEEKQASTELIHKATAENIENAQRR